VIHGDLDDFDLVSSPVKLLLGERMMKPPVRLEALKLRTRGDANAPALGIPSEWMRHEELR
jgi:hypothetical protein